MNFNTYHLMFCISVTLMSWETKALWIPDSVKEDDVTDDDYDIRDDLRERPETDNPRDPGRAYRLEKKNRIMRHLEENQRHQPCFRTRDAYDRLLNMVGTVSGYDRPHCYEDGTFMPKQCKGDICHCMAPDGTKLGRYRQERHKAHNMHCLCALDQYGLSLFGMKEAFACSGSGSYRRVQCYHNTCFCTDDHGAILESIAPVHISLRQHLNCKPAKS